LRHTGRKELFDYMVAYNFFDIERYQGKSLVSTHCVVPTGLTFILNSSKIGIFRNEGLLLRTI